MISARLGQEPDTAFATACHTATGGNPLLLHELTKAIQVDGTPPVAANIGVVDELGPRAASRAVLLRLARLSDEAGRIVRAAAVFDEGFTVPMLAALAEIDEQAAARAVGELIQAEILRGEQPLGFVHPLIRAAVYQDISLGERELEHARAARLLADAGASAERIASHLLVVPPRGDPWVAATLREAARKAMHKGAPDGAVRYFQRALDEPPPEEELTAAQFELGLAQSLTNAPAAVEHLSVAYERLTDPLSVGLAANVLARAMIWQAPAEAAAFARRAASRMPDEPADYRLSIEAVEAALTAFGVDSPEALERLLPFRDPNRIDGSVGSKMMAAVAAWQWSLANGPADVCVELADKALAGGELIAADHGLLPMFAIATYHVADSEQVMAAWEQMLAETHRSGSMFAITTTYLWRGFTLYRRGDLEEAALSLRSAVDTFPSYGYGVSGMAYTGAHLTRILYESGDPAGARAAFDVSPEPPPDADAYRYWALAKVAVLMHEGREAEVAEVIDKIPRHLPWIVNPADTFWRCLKAEALDRLDRRDEALELVAGGARAGAGVGGAGNRRARAAHARHARARERSRAPGRGGRAAGAVDDQARIRKGAVCLRDDVAPGAQADRCPRAPAQGARSRQPLRRGAAGRARPHRASRNRRPSPPRRRQRRCLADPIRKPRRRPRRRWHVEPRDRPGALRDAEDGRGPPLEHVSQARDPLAPRALRRPRPRLGLRIAKVWGGA